MTRRRSNPREVPTAADAVAATRALFFSNTGPIAQTGRDLLRSLRTAGVEHVLVGDAAGCVYAEQATVSPIAMPPQTAELDWPVRRFDVCLRPPDVERYRQTVVGRDFEAVPGQRSRLLHPHTGVEIDLLSAGEVVGDPLRQREIRWPDPHAAVWLAGVPVPPLERLVELLLAEFSEHGRSTVISLLALTGAPAERCACVHPLLRGELDACFAAARRMPGV